jgi:putative ABC transport system substrate-binding protein
MAPHRRIIITLALSLLMLPLGAAAQKPAKLPSVGVLEPEYPPTVVPQSCSVVFRQALGELGYQEGENVLLEYRYGENQPDRFPTLAAELVQRQPDVLWTHSSLAAQALKQATTTIPIVVGVAVDLVEQGLVESPAQPGGNLTGLDTRYLELTGKRLELLKDAVPHITRVAILIDPAGNRRVLDLIPSAFAAEARTLGLHLLRVEAGDHSAFEAAFASMAHHRADAIVLMDSRIFRLHRQRLLSLAVAHRLPTMAPIRAYVEAGGLLAYGADPAALCRRSAIFVDKILKGATPADLPVEGADTFSLVVNLKTAAALGLTLPPVLLLQANEVLK